MAETTNAAQAGGTALYLDDIAVGDRFTTDGHAVDAEQIKAFANLFDPQPFHLDEEAAKDSLFEGLAASGWHTASITMRLLVTSGPKMAKGIIGGGGEIAWPKPTRPGDVLHVEAEVVEIMPSRSKAGRAMVRMHCETRNQNGDVLQVFTPKMVVDSRRMP